MSKYAKLIAAVLGVIIMAVKEFTDFDLTAQQDMIFNIIVMVATAAGVWAVPNKPA